MRNQPPVTREQKEFFRANGYLAYGPILTPQEVESLRNEVQLLIELKKPNFYRADLARAAADPRPYLGQLADEPEPTFGQEKFLQMLGLWRVNEAIRKITLDKRRAQIAAELLEVSSVRLLSDMVLSKPGGGSPPTYWHQDYPDHPTSLPDVTAWIALDATFLANGCMHYLPGSHTRGELVPYDYEGGAGVVKAGVDTSAAVAVEMQPGDVTFHHSLTLHYAGANQTTQARRAYITRYMPAQTVYRFRKPGRDDKEREGEAFSDLDYPIIV
ncbi:MAG TPA: phytanoyl-CoA dioxygenase family protein [Acidobacteriota bacterium]|jgi:hypothetical protein